MTIITTNWDSHKTKLDSFVQGEQQPVDLLYGSNAPVSIDMAPMLNEGEAVVNPIATFTRLPASGETDYSNYPTGLEGTPVIEGTVVSQLIQNLERGRVYRLEILIGATDNRRGPSILVRCPE